MRCEWPGSSLSQMIAVSLRFFARCRSVQLTETFSTPSENQRMRKSSRLNDTSFTWVKGLIQASRSALAAQKASGASMASRYSSS